MIREKAICRASLALAPWNLLRFGVNLMGMAALDSGAAAAGLPAWKMYKSSPKDEENSREH